MILPPDQDPLLETGRYMKIKNLGSGAFGMVQLAQNRQTNESVAVKLIKRERERVKSYVETEILNHRRLRHPHVIEFKEAFLTRDFICIAMEYASGGNLFEYVKEAGRLQEPACRWFFQQLIIALDYCHRVGVFNRDIKLENTLLQRVPDLPLPLLKICDFGYSKSRLLSEPKSKVGTLAYMAPEVFTGDRYDGAAADIWSCGVMLYLMLFGNYPFDPVTQDPRALKHRIVNNLWVIPSDIPISPEARDLLHGMLVPNPSIRVTVGQITRHPWFLTNLPPNALAMNDEYLHHPDWTGVQSEEEVQQILADACALSHIPLQDDDLIDESIDREIEAGTISFNSSGGI